MLVLQEQGSECSRGQVGVPWTALAGRGTLPPGMHMSKPLELGSGALGHTVPWDATIQAGTLTQTAEGLGSMASAAQPQKALEMSL